MFGRGGSISLASSPPPFPGAITAYPEPRDPPPRPSGSDYKGEHIYGLDASVGTDFTASDVLCAGKGKLANGGDVSWDLSLTKLHTGCRTDWNPLAPMQKLPLCGEEDPPAMPLMKHTVAFPNAFYPCFLAYYMSHNMNSFISGSIDWNGQKYDFDNLKGYQDSNWGAGGFPHPYVWMQANNFSDRVTGTPQYDTSLVALFTPAMPLTGVSLMNSTPVAGICLRHAGKIYQVIGVDPKLLLVGSALSPSAVYIIEQGIPELGLIQCSVFFLQSGSIKTVDMAKGKSEVDSQIGEFDETLGRNSPAVPVKFALHGANFDKDQIDILVECAEKTVMSLATPMNGKMVKDVTKETLLGRFSVVLRPKGGTAINLTSDIGTAEYGD